MLSIGALASAAQGASYYERDGYYAKDDPEHRAASAWAGKGAEELGLKGPVDPDTFRAILEGKVPDGSDTRLGRRGKDGEILHRPGRDLTFSAPKSVSIAALVGGDDRIVEAHDRAVKATLAWVEKNAAETRMKAPETGRMGRVGGQKIVAATFRHDTSRNLDPQLHSHSVIANMVQGEDGKWRSMANEGLYARQKLIGMLYRNELAGSLARLGYGIEKTHADGRFEVAGVSRDTIEAFSTRRAEIEAAMAERNLGNSADNPRLGRTRGADDARRQARHRPGGIAGRLAETGRRSRARCRSAGIGSRRQIRDAGVGKRSRNRQAGRARNGLRRLRNGPGHRRHATSGLPGDEETIGRSGAWPGPGTHVRSGNNSGSFGCIACVRSGCLGDGASLRARGGVRPRRSSSLPRSRMRPARSPSRRRNARLQALEKAGTRCTPWTCTAPRIRSPQTKRTVGEERETVASMRAGQSRGAVPMRGWQVQGYLSKGPLTAGQKDAVKLILAAEDRVIGVQGYAGSGKTTMLDRARVLAGKKGYRMIGLAPSASAVQTLAAEAGIESETLQMLPRPQRGRRRGQADDEGREGNARRLREDHPGGRRGLARLHRAGPRPAPDRERAPHSRAWCWWATRNSSTRSMPASRSPSSRLPG